MTTLRAIARRAGISSSVRVDALIMCAGNSSEDAGDALRLMTERQPVYPEVYTAFEAESSLLALRRV